MFKSKDIARIGNMLPTTSIVIINNALVRTIVSRSPVSTIFSSSPEDYNPFSIRFSVEGVQYDLTGARHLKKVCKLYKKRHKHDLYFTAILVIEDFIFDKKDNKWYGDIIEVR